MALFLPDYLIKSPDELVKMKKNCMVSNIKTKCTKVELHNKTHTLKKVKMHEKKY